MDYKKLNWQTFPLHAFSKNELDELCQTERADERRKFAEWLEKKDLLTLWHGDNDYETLNAEKVLAMYEKEQKGETE